jgi:hypothetical protein
MHAVISCRKYATRTLKLVDVGDMSKQETLDRLGNWGACECPVCGPLSHTELDFSNFFEIHGELHETLEDATKAMWLLYDSRSSDFRCDGPPRLEAAV